MDKIQAGGGTVLFGPQEVPGGSQIVQALDPQVPISHWWEGLEGGYTSVMNTMLMTTRKPAP